MKRRWRLLIAAGGLLAAAVLVPVAGIEVGCRAPIAGLDPHTPIARSSARGAPKRGRG